MNLTELGRKIQLAREEKKIAQEQLAEAIGCSQSTLSNYENGKRRIYLSQLEKLSEVLDKPLAYFVEGLDNPDEMNPVANNTDNALIRLMYEVYGLNNEERKLTEEFIQYLKWRRVKGEQAHGFFIK